MRVSVVLLTYNHERFVAQAIESVLGQVGVDFELVVSEDCSTDGTRDVLRRYADRLPGRIRLMLGEHNVGMTAALARGLQAARGDYVAFMDGDDFWTAPDKLARQVAYLDAHPSCALCFHAVRVVDETGADVEGDDRAGGDHAVGAGVTSYRLSDLLERNPVPGCSPLMRREALAALPPWFYDAEYGDWPMYLHVAHAGTVDGLPEVLGAYRRHGTGYWTRQSRRDQLEGRLRFNALLLRSLGGSHAERLTQIDAGLRARLVRACAADGAVIGAVGHLLALLRTTVGSPRRTLGGGGWRRLSAALVGRPATATATATATAAVGASGAGAADAAPTEQP